jgi:hypothetical protein
MNTIQIVSNNYNQQNAHIIFYSVDNPSTPIDLGVHQIPYTRESQDVYGTYVATFPDFKNKQCSITINNDQTT